MEEEEALIVAEEVDITEGVEDLIEVEEADTIEAAEAVLTSSKTTVLQNMLLHWESSCIHVRMTLCASVQQTKTKFPTSTPQSTWRTRSRSGKWMRYLASCAIFIFQSNCQKT